MSREVNVMDEKWDWLIVLDACRYDYFSAVFEAYLKGNLDKVLSPASTTDEWCLKSFHNHYDDVVYVSANPIINSKTEVNEFIARNHFFRVIDVWSFGWNENLGTVHPQKINETVRRVKHKYFDKRFVIHYIQPHAPYLVFGPNAGLLQTRPDPASGVVTAKANNIKNEITDRSVRLLAYLADKIGLAQPPGHVGRHRALRWKIRELLNLPAETYVDDLRRKVGDIGLRQAYKMNLELVLSYVAELIESLSGIIVVTADHGELLGENSCYLHFRGSKDPLLREVPWLTIQKPRNETDGRDEKRHIAKRIRRLKTLGFA